MTGEERLTSSSNQTSAAVEAAAGAAETGAAAPTPPARARDGAGGVSTRRAHPTRRVAPRLGFRVRSRGLYGWRGISVCSRLWPESSGPDPCGIGGCGGVPAASSITTLHERAHMKCRFCCNLPSLRGGGRACMSARHGPDFVSLKESRDPAASLMGCQSPSASVRARVRALSKQCGTTRTFRTGRYKRLGTTIGGPLGAITGGTLRNGQLGAIISPDPRSCATAAHSMVGYLGRVGCAATASPRRAPGAATVTVKPRTSEGAPAALAPVMGCATARLSGRARAAGASPGRRLRSLTVSLSFKFWHQGQHWISRCANGRARRPQWPPHLRKPASGSRRTDRAAAQPQVFDCFSFLYLFIVLR